MFSNLTRPQPPDVPSSSRKKSVSSLRTSQIQSNQAITVNGTSCSPQSPSSAAWIGKNTVYTNSNQIDHDVDPVALASLGSPVQYDTTYGSGIVVADGQNGGTPHSYLYDGEGRICAVKTPSGIPGNDTMTQYLYDAEGNRIGRGTITTWSCNLDLPNGFQLTNEYILGQAGEPVTELDGNDNWIHTNAYAGGELIGTYDTAGEHTYNDPALHYQLADWLGTRRMQVSSTGAMEETCQSQPFGDQMDCEVTSLATSDDATEHHFTGKERDAESGLDYFPARYLTSTMGRWMSPDPGWLAAADLANPQTLNAYSYVGNSPLVYDDPTGMWGCNDAGTQPAASNGAMAVIGAIGNFFRNLGCAIGGLGSNNSNSSTSGQGNTQSTTSNVTGSAGMEVISVVLKFGANSQMPTSRTYSNSDPFSQNFRKSYEADRIRADIANCSVSGRPTSGRGAGGVGTFTAGARAPRDAARGSIAALQVGGFSYGFDRDGATVHVHVVNDVTLDSLFYHIPSAYNSGVGLGLSLGSGVDLPAFIPEENSSGHFTTIHQSLNYDEANPCS